MGKQRCFVVEEAITETLPQHQSLIFLYRVGGGFFLERTGALFVPPESLSL